MVLLEAGLQPLQDRDGLLDARLGDIDLLEPPRERVVLLEYAAIFLVGRRADTAYFAVRQYRLDQVARIHDTAGCRACADDGVNFVNKEYRARVLLDFLDYALEALFEVTAILGARNQRAHVERIDRRVAQHLRHPLLGNHSRQALREGRLADTRITDVQGVVLPAAAAY